jgi:hypothetical protein
LYTDNERTIESRKSDVSYQRLQQFQLVVLVSRTGIGVDETVEDSSAAKSHRIGVIHRSEAVLPASIVAASGRSTRR